MSRGLKVTELQNIQSPHVYVLNMGVKLYQKKTDYMVPLDIGPNEKKSITIPSTWIPIDLGEIIDKELLISNFHFRQLINNGHLKLLRDEEAEAMLDSDEAKEELTRIQAERLAHDVAMPSPSEQVEIDAKNRPGAKLAVGEVDPDGDDNVNPMVFDIMSRDDLTDSSRQSQLRTLADSMTANDWAFVQRKTSNSGILKMMKAHNK